MNLYRVVDHLRWSLSRLRQAPDRALGERGEDLAQRFLQKHGFTVVARNYRTRGGEVDLIAWEKDTLAMVEVKTRTSDAVSAPGRAVDAEKQRRVMRAAKAYARRAEISWESLRFDVLNIVDTRPIEIQYIRAAFGPGFDPDHSPPAIWRDFLLE